MRNRRRIHETLALDQQLRQARSIWMSIVIIFALPAAAGAFAVFVAFLSVVNSLSGVEADISSVVWNVMFGAVAILAELLAIGRFREAGRRLKILKDDPKAQVRPVPAPFQSSLFGPYH